MIKIGLSNKEWNIISSMLPKEDPLEFIGDDCAIWRDKNILITTDHMAEGHHFDFSYMPAHAIGWRLMAANASDIIAMGSRPNYFLLNVAAPKERFSELEEILRGIRDFATRYNITIMGGDTTGGSAFFLGVTMFGEKQETPWERSSARVGDKVFIAHYPGLSKAGLYHLQQGNDGFDEAKERFLYPDPFSFAPFCGSIHAAIDISDSLYSELQLISSFSGVSVEIDLDKIPLHNEVVQTARMMGCTPEQLMLSSGEEFFLLVTSPDDVVGFFEIGKVTAKGESNVIYKKNGSYTDPAVDIYAHFG